MEKTNIDIKGLSVNEMTALRNKLDAAIIAETTKRTEANADLLREEIMNLIDGVGRGYTEGDYYAPDRYYSDIEGVKNIRFYGDNTIIVKILSPVGDLMPEKIEVRGTTYDIVCTKSDKYASTVDY